MFPAADEFGAHRAGDTVEQVGAQLGPSRGHLVDQVPGHGVEIAGEPVLVGAEEQGEMVAGVAVPVDVDAAIAGVGGAGDEGTGGQKDSKEVAPGAVGAGAQGRRRAE